MIAATNLHRYLHLSLLILGLVLLPVRLRAQQGQNAVYNSSGSATTNSPSFLDASQFTSAGDACQAVAAAFGALPPGTTSGTVDARGLIPGGHATTLPCSVNPLVNPLTSAAFQGTLLLGAATYLAQVPWVISGNQLNIIGIAAGPPLFRPASQARQIAVAWCFRPGVP